MVDEDVVVGFEIAVGGGGAVRFGAGSIDANRERFSVVAESLDAPVADDRGASSFAISLSDLSFSASSRSFSRMASASIDLNATGPADFDGALFDSARRREPIMPDAGTFSGGSLLDAPSAALSSAGRFCPLAFGGGRPSGFLVGGGNDKPPVALNVEPPLEVVALPAAVVVVAVEASGVVVDVALSSESEA